MNERKDSKKSNRMSKRAALLVFSLVMILSVTVGGTLAYMIMATDNVTNTFEPGVVETTTEEEFNGEVKKDVKVDAANSNVDVCVRAKVVVNWVDSNGNVVATTPPVRDFDYTMTYAEGWTEVGGYWYYDEVVPAKKSATLISSCQPNHDGSNGERLQVTILTQSIQAHPDAVRATGWPMSLTAKEGGGYTVNVPAN